MTPSSEERVAAELRDLRAALVSASLAATEHRAAITGTLESMRGRIGEIHRYLFESEPSVPVKIDRLEQTIANQRRWLLIIGSSVVAALIALLFEVVLGPNGLYK